MESVDYCFNQVLSATSTQEGSYLFLRVYLEFSTIFLVEGYEKKEIQGWDSLILFFSSFLFISVEPALDSSGGREGRKRFLKSICLEEGQGQLP